MAQHSTAENNQTEGPLILGVSWLLIAVPGVTLALRIFCKTVLSRGLGWDDLVIVFAWLLHVTYTGMITHGVKIGVIGKHVYAIEDASKIPEGLKMVYISFVIIIFGCVFAKTSFAITLLRIVTRPWMKISLWFIIISMNILMWTTGVSYLAQCSPAAALWRTELLATAKCWPPIAFEVLGMTAGAYSGFMDFVLSLFPWVILWNLQMNKREKFGIALAMSMGIFAAVTAFIKTSKLVNVTEIKDFTYFCTSLILWASAETGLTIFAASIPSLRLIIARMRSSYDRMDESQKYGLHSSSRRTAPRRGDASHDTDPYYYMGGEAITLADRKDDSSDKSILGKSTIQQTQEISVTYEHSMDEEGMAANRVDTFPARLHSSPIRF
ncbi:hypothetical protein N7470_007179 [Penicillium chermesinum]|nr:hypothetical protein N7470_007179 [Penicillium chermesinum]